MAWKRFADIRVSRHESDDGWFFVSVEMEYGRLVSFAPTIHEALSTLATGIMLSECDGDSLRPGER